MTDIRRLDTVAEAARASALFRAVWGTDEASAPVVPALVRALDHAGCYAYGAYDGDGALLGASLAFLAGAPGDLTLYSHITGVVARAQGRGVGRALKLHQRDWALARGIDRAAWTFDPLMRRNAAFNLRALGAVPSEYLTDFYGPMPDGVNRGDETDRLLVVWHLADARPAAPAGDVPALLADEGGEPARRDTGDATAVTVAVPADVEALRGSDPALARRWRHAVRDALGGRMRDGWTVAGFGDAGYLLRRVSVR